MKDRVSRAARGFAPGDGDERVAPLAAVSAHDPLLAFFQHRVFVVVRLVADHLVGQFQGLAQGREAGPVRWGIDDGHAFLVRIGTSSPFLSMYAVSPLRPWT